MPGRHKGVGMNKPKKKRVEVQHWLKVSLLLRGIEPDAPVPLEAPGDEGSNVTSPIDIQAGLRRNMIEAQKLAREVAKIWKNVDKQMARADEEYKAHEKILEWLESLPRQRLARERRYVAKEIACTKHDKEIADRTWWMLYKYHGELNGECMHTRD